MRVYHERPRVPVTWWLLGLGTIAVLATETVAGWPLLVAVAIYTVLVGLVVAMLLNWGRASIDVTGGELRVGQARLPLADTGQVTALDETQTRSLRGPRGDPAAFLFIRPYLRVAVYVEVTSPAAPDPAAADPAAADPAAAGPAAQGAGGTAAAAGRPGRLPWRRDRRARPEPGAGAPYWLVCTRRPAELAAAISASRPAARINGATMG
jgi:hypothetical protein